MIDAYFITFPRSGKNWLNWYIDNNTDINAEFAHYVKVDNYTHSDFFKSEMYRIQEEANKNIYKIITTVRSPEESLASINIMENFSNTEFRSKQYLDHYRYMIENNVTMFNFEDIKNNTDSVVKNICKKLNKNFYNKPLHFSEYSVWHTETQDSRKTVTSKKDKGYMEYLKFLKLSDMNEHRNLYNLCLERCEVVKDN